jgi:cytochrome c oxidase subunit II
MSEDYRLFPIAASADASRVDALYFFLLAVTCFFSVLIFLLIVYFALYYRDGRNVDRSRPVHENLAVEIGWSLIPLGLTMIMFLWGATLFVQGSQAPPDAMTIDVIGKQWMWRIYHANGKRELNELHIPVGQPVKLRMISDDVIHSFYIPAFRNKMDVLPGRRTEISFTPSRPGEYHLFCAEYCGTDHSRMRGSVVVMEPRAFADWISNVTDEEPVVAGARLFTQHRCDNCHGSGPQSRCPPLGGLFGKPVTLDNGRTVIADDDYLRESILNPALHIVAGYRNEMPLIANLSEEDVLNLTAYIKSLPAEDQAAPRP